MTRGARKKKKKQTLSLGPQPDPTTSWECSFCCYENPASFHQRSDCFQCKGPREGVPMSALPSCPGAVPPDLDLRELTSWTCDSCTLVNSPDCFVCSACGARAHARQSTEWICDTCTYSNDSIVGSCAMCERPWTAPSGVVTPLPRCNSSALEPPVTTSISNHRQHEENPGVAGSFDCRNLFADGKPDNSAVRDTLDEFFLNWQTVHHGETSESGSVSSSGPSSPVLAGLSGDSELKYIPPPTVALYRDKQVQSFMRQVRMEASKKPVASPAADEWQVQGNNRGNSKPGDLTNMIRAQPP